MTWFLAPFEFIIGLFLALIFCGIIAAVIVHGFEMLEDWWFRSGKQKLWRIKNKG